MPSRPTLIHFPSHIIALMDKASVEINPDRKSNRSMFVRAAVVEKLERMGLNGGGKVPPARRSR
jgi:hypothetical protein